jgi:hypothetical protein
VPEQPRLMKKIFRIRTAVNTAILATMLSAIEDDVWQVMTVLHDGERFVIVTFRLVPR